MFNHESPRRGENFVSRKITLSLAEILKGQREKLILGNLNAIRDWGYASDYVEAMWLMLQQDQPEDFVIATGECHSVRDFVEIAFGLCGIELQWIGEGVNEKGFDRATGRELVCCSPKYYRPVEVPYLRGDYTKARTKLGWNPKVSFRQLVELMVYHDLVTHNVECPFTPSFTENGVRKGYKL